MASSYPDYRQWSDFPRSKASSYFPFHCRKIRLNHSFPSHRHDYLELSFIVQGEGYQLIDNKKYLMRPGTLMLLLPYQVQEMVLDSGRPLVLYNCAFDVHLLRSALGPDAGLEELLTLGEDSVPSIQLNNEDREIVESLFQKLVEEYENDYKWRMQQIQSHLWHLIIQLDRFRAIAPNEGAGRQQYSLTIWNVIRYVHLNYNQPITLSELASKFGMSSSYLSEQFKNHLGVNFVRFLHEIRVRHACSLLSSTEMSILDIAMEVGCNSSRSFTRIFQDIKKVTPSEYRKQMIIPPPVNGKG